MVETRGKLIVSTKSQAAGRKTVLIVCSILLYLLAVFMLLNREIFASMGADLFHSVTAGQILGWGCIIFFAAWPTYMLLVTSKGTKSYCDVYEEAVVGVTAFNPSNPSAAMQHFELPYAQIINVTESKYNLTIYTNHGSYEVMALKKRPEAMQEIRARMNGGQK